MPQPIHADGPGRLRIAFEYRAALFEAAGRLLEDPLVESCSIDVPNLVVEVGLTSRVVQQQQQAADWLGRFRRSAGGPGPFGGAPVPMDPQAMDPEAAD